MASLRYLYFKPVTITTFVKSLMAPECLVWAKLGFCVSKVISGTGFSGSDESAELKLDRGWEGIGIDQEVDEYKTESKV